MAIGSKFFALVTNTVNHIIQKQNKIPPLETACLSYLDLMIADSFLRKMMGDPFVDSLTPVSHLETLKENHPSIDIEDKFYETESALRALGLNTTFFDVKAHRGIEKILDLNEDLPDQYHRKYELVIDCGTLEHCFNVGNAFKSMCDLADVGGVVITSAPLNSLNHGFWNFNPTVYVDGFTQNGFSMMGLFLLTPESSEGDLKLFDISSDWMSRSMDLPPECGIACMAMRKSDQPFKMPVQSKYKHLLS